MRYIAAGVNVVVTTKLGTVVRGMLLEPMLGSVPVTVLPYGDGVCERVPVTYGPREVESVEPATWQPSF